MAIPRTILDRDEAHAGFHELTRNEQEASGIFTSEFRAGLDDASRLLAALAPQVAVYQFEEVVPSIEDLFVQTVQVV